MSKRILVFEIAFCIVAVVISGDIIQRAERDIDITLSVESERLSEIDVNETLGTPPPYSDFCFYMDQDNKQGMDEMWRSSGLTMEQISYWRSVYSQQYIFQSEQQQLTSDDIRDTAENNHYIRYFGILRVVMKILAVFSGICIIPCVFLALKQEWALPAVLGSCKLIITIAALHSNLITAVVAAYSITNITRLIQKAEHGCTYDRLGNIDGQNKEKPLILDSNQWRCSSCGYINEHPAAECRSCGKYK